MRQPTVKFLDVRSNSRLPSPEGLRITRATAINYVGIVYLVEKASDRVQVVMMAPEVAHLIGE